MSGGVDSSVMAALLHRAGYEVIGISMQLFDKKTTQDSDGKCCTLDDFQDARRVAFECGFAHYVMDFEARFRATVIEGFIAWFTIRWAIGFKWSATFTAVRWFALSDGKAPFQIGLARS